MMEKVFLGNLAGEVNEGTLRKLLEKEGITFNGISMKRNFAFVTVEDKLAAEEIVKKFNGLSLEGSVIQAEPSNGRKSRRTNKIHIRNIPSLCSKEQIEDLVNAISEGSVKFEHGSEGTAYITFNTAEEAEDCLEQLNDYRFEDSSQLKVEFFKSPKRSNRSNSSSNSGFSRQDMPLRMLIGSDYVGAVIGKQGQTIKKITSDSRARVDIHRRESHVPETMVTIKGSPESCSVACRDIMAVVRNEAESLNRGDVPFKIMCPNNICGRIIGRQGNVIKVFMEKSKTNIVVSSFDSPFPGSIMDANYFDRVITITGSTENCSRAEDIISEKMRQCFEQDSGSYQQYNTQPSAMYPNMPSLSMLPGMSPYQGLRHPPMPYMGAGFYPGSYGNLPQVQTQQPEVVQLYIPEKSVGAVIGSKGQNIKNIMRLSGARIKILGANDKTGGGESSSHNQPGDERRAVISGSSEAQWKAQFYIFEKVKNELRLNAHDEVHLRTEITVPKQSIGRIIGKGGQNVKEMQRVSGAIVQLPVEEQGDVEEAQVTIIGHFYATQSAQRRVRALMNAFTRVQPQPRRIRPGAPQQLM